MRPPLWMAWNLFLAGVPLALSLWLFRWSRRRSALWWLAAAVFLAFLPNAPYVLSDTVHLVARMRAEPSWPFALLLVGGFGLFLLLGFEAYVLCIANVRHYLRRSGYGRLALPVEIGLHAVCAVGVYLGRVLRFNSWDLIGEGDAVVMRAVRHLGRPWPVMLVAFTFVVMAVGCQVLTRVNLATIRLAGRRPPR